jgi:hypothetical protein
MSKPRTSGAGPARARARPPPAPAAPARLSALRPQLSLALLHSQRQRATSYQPGRPNPASRPCAAPAPKTSARSRARAYTHAHDDKCFAASALASSPHRHAQPCGTRRCPTSMRRTSSMHGRETPRALRIRKLPRCPSPLLCPTPPEGEERNNRRLAPSRHPYRSNASISPPTAGLRCRPTLPCRSQQPSPLGASVGHQPCSPRQPGWAPLTNGGRRRPPVNTRS